MKYFILIFFALLFGVACQKQNNAEIAGATFENTQGILAGQALTSNNVMAKSIVYVQEKQGLPQKAFTCTGTLISRRVVLLAAHCVQFAQTNPGLLNLYFSTDPFTDINTSKDIYRKALRVIPHTKYNPLNQLEGYDLALVYLSAEAPLHARAAEVSSDLNFDYAQSEVAVAGYGKTTNYRVKQTSPVILRSVEVSFLQEWLTEKYKNGADSDLFVFDQRQAKGACSGDSGGPAFVKRDGHWQVFGVASFAFNLEDALKSCSGASAYINIEYYRPWLKEKFQLLSSEPNPF